MKLLKHLKARGLLARAIDKTESLLQAGTFIVVDASGAPVSAARMDGCSAGALPLVRAKAFGSAVNGEPSSRFAARMAKFGAGVLATYQAVLRDQPFPGAGGMPIREDGEGIGAIATGLGIGPFVKLPGVSPSQLIVDGKPGNLEDIVISYAMGCPYNPQHGDDMERWVEAFGAPPDPSVQGTGMAPAPAASRQQQLSAAQAVADRAMALASDKRACVAVAIVDALGDPITLDRMDGAAPMGIDVAAAVAVASVNFRLPSAEIAARKSIGAALDRLLEVMPYRMLALPGGYPIFGTAGLEGGLGIYCEDFDLAHELAQEAVEWAVAQAKGAH